MIQIMKYGQVPDSEIFARVTPAADVAAVVSEIIENVKKSGDRAVLDYTRRFDKAAPETLKVSPEEMEEAVSLVEPEFLAILERAAENIRAFHARQVRNSFVIADRPGIVLGQKVTPIEKVGVYVPGGTAAYPSTVLMDTIPAKIAGCPHIVMVTPPGRDGKIAPVILAAAKIAGVDAVYKVGGAQAVAALAYGTESIPRVDKIVGPGNAFVAEAKKQVFGLVSIDMIAGPSEILIVADGKSNPVHAAADMLSQAEHDRLASAVLVTDSEDLARAVSAELERQLKELPREEIARASIDSNGKIIVAENLMQGIGIANRIAPEHLELMVDNPFDYLDAVKNAGSIFMGRSCPEALGDYFAGPNHTLPTSGTARFSSPLSVDDFVKKSQFTYYTESALSSVAEDIDRFANREGLQAHGRSVMVRQEGESMSRFLNEQYRTLEAYTPGEQPRDMKYIKLNTNESPYPPAPGVVAAITAEDVELLRLYSDPTASALKEKLAGLYGVKPENIFLSNGSDEVLSFAFMAFGGRGVCFPDISYGFYEVYADLYGMEAKKVPLREDFTVDHRDYCGQNKMVVIANPNAPTGLSIPVYRIEEILKSDPDSLVLIDEAYVDFGGETCLPLLERYDNLLITRTFSKSRCLAGGRLGYAFGSPAIIADLEKIKFSTNPYNLDRLTLKLGEATVEAESYYQEKCAEIMATRAWVTEELQNLGFTVLPSKANFVFAKTDRMEGLAMYQQLRDRGILVRHFTNERICRFNRITIGTGEQMAAFIAAVKDILGENL